MTPVEVAFFSTVLATGSGLIGLIVRAGLKSNCIYCKFWGCECRRETTHEPRELELNSVAL